MSKNTTIDEPNIKLNFFTEKQIRKIINNIQQNISSLRKKYNNYNKRGKVKFPDSYTDFERGFYLGRLAGLKESNRLITNFLKNINLSDINDRNIELLKIDNGIKIIDYSNNKCIVYTVKACDEYCKNCNITK